MCIYYSPHTVQVYFIQCSLILPFDPLLGHDFLHAYKIISKILAEVLQSEGSHEMEFDGVYQTMVFTLYHSAKWKCPKCGKVALCCSLVPFVFFIPTLEVKSQ